MKIQIKFFIQLFKKSQCSDRMRLFYH